MIRYPKSWKATGNVFDHGHKETRCALCQRCSRYVFEIMSRTGRHALVGPECLKKVQVPGAVAESIEVDDWLSQHKSELQTDARRRRLKKILMHLRSAAPEAQVGGLFKNIDQGLPFSPAQASWLVGMCARHHLDIGKDLIQIDMRTKSARAQISQLADWQIEQLGSALVDRRRATLIQLAGVDANSNPDRTAATS